MAEVSVDGSAVGDAVVGTADGSAVGDAVGTADGSAVGVAVGNAVVGTAVGLAVGSAVGNAVVGTADGSAVGDAVGSAVGATEPRTTTPRRLKIAKSSTRCMAAVNCARLVLRRYVIVAVKLSYEEVNCEVGTW